MKLNTILTLTVFCICILISYTIYINAPIETKMIYTFGSFLFFLVVSIGSISLSFEQIRTTTNIKFISGSFFFIGLVFHFLSCTFKLNESTYIVSIGILFLTYALVSYLIAEKNQ